VDRKVPGSSKPWKSLLQRRPIAAAWNLLQTSAVLTLEEIRMLARRRYGRWIALDRVHAAVYSIALLARAAAA